MKFIQTIPIYLIYFLLTSFTCFFGIQTTKAAEKLAEAAAAKTEAAKTEAAEAADGAAKAAEAKEIIDNYNNIKKIAKDIIDNAEEEL